MRVLVVSPLFPVPIRSGGHTRLFHLLRQMGRRHEVHFISLVTGQAGEAAGALEGLHEPAEQVLVRQNHTLGQRVSEAIHPRTWPRTVRRTLERLSGWPHNVTRGYFPELASRIRRALRRATYDVVQLEFTAMGRYLPLVRRLAPSARAILDEIDITYVAIDRMADCAPPGVARRLRTEARRMARFERLLWHRVDGVVTMSDVDCDLVGREAPETCVAAVPNGVDLEYFAYRPRSMNGRRILFVGWFRHPPNVAGLRYFCGDIWPEIHRRLPDATLDVVGAEAPADLAALDGRDGVRMHGYVPDVRPLMASASAMVAPIVSGAGTRLKVMEAFAAGVPLVSTTLGCEGIDAHDGREVLLADAPDGFAAVVERLVRNPVRAQALARNARRLVERRYGWEAIGQRLEEVWSHA